MYGNVEYMRAGQGCGAVLPDVWDSELLGSASPDTESSSSFSSTPILFTVSILPRHSPSSRIYRMDVCQVITITKTFILDN